MATNTYDILVLLTGTPADQYQQLIVYIFANVLSIIMILAFLYIFKLISGMIRKV